MTRPADFSLTVKRGVRAVQPDLVVHALRSSHGDCFRAPHFADDAPKIGLVVAKSVGTAVQRHRVSRKLRHVARGVLADLNAGDKIVIRALPGSRYAISARLEQELKSALRRSSEGPGNRR